MAVRTPPRARASAAAGALPRVLPLPLSLVLAAALPILFLHVDYQPGFTVSLGSADAHVVLADIAVAAVAVAALAAGRARGFAPLRAGAPAWSMGGLFLAMVGAASLYPRLWTSSYDWTTHVVSAGKFVEYGLLALAVPLLVRERRDLELVLASLTAWCAAAAAVGVAQILGLDILGSWGAGRRQPSFLGHYDLAALSGAALAVALVSIALGGSWRLPRGLVPVAGVAGCLGLVVSGSSAGAIGIGAAAAAALVAARRLGLGTLRRAGAVAAIAAVTIGGVLVLRSGDFNQFLRYLGVGSAEVEKENVQTYVHRTLLLYIGLRVFEDNPLAGAGWQASGKEIATYGPYLDDARREFPQAPPIAFPSPERPWGVQNAYVQALADLGLIGLVLLLATLVAGLWLAARRVAPPPAEAAPAILAACWLLVTIGTLTAVGLVAGLPLDALLWLSLGLAACAASGARLARS